MKLDGLSLHCNIFAQSMMESYKEDSKKARLFNTFDNAYDDAEFLSFAVNGENWPIYKNVFFSLFPVFPFGLIKYCLNREAVARFASEGIDLLKTIVYSSENADDPYSNDTVLCFFYLIEKFYDGNVNTLLKTDEEKQRTFIDPLDYINSEKTDEYKTRLEQLRGDI
jgi:hypothetical protein